MVCRRGCAGLPDVDDPVCLRRPMRQGGRSVNIMLGLVGQFFGAGEKTIQSLDDLPLNYLGSSWHEIRRTSRQGKCVKHAQRRGAKC